MNRHTLYRLLAFPKRGGALDPTERVLRCFRVYYWSYGEQAYLYLTEAKKKPEQII